MVMQRLGLLLACVTCPGHGWQVDSPTKIIQSSRSTKVQTPQSCPLEALRMLLTSGNTAAADVPYVEFYSGVGGWTMALEGAWRRIPGKSSLRRAAALDNSDLCTRVFEHNFGSDKKTFNIERLALEDVEAWRAKIWVMSPPCQPHTRQHSNQSKDLVDPRSASFLHLCDLLGEMDESALPSVLLLENVIGFESSNSFRRWQGVLEKRDYSVIHFHLTPPQVQIPNDRPRHFSVAVLTSKLVEKDGSRRDSGLLPQLHWEGRKGTIQTELPEMYIAPAEATTTGEHLPTIATFLQDKPFDESLRIPAKIFAKSASWCFDIVTPSERRSACFTSSYGRYNKGTGSILYDGSCDGRNFDLVEPERREFDGDWAESVDVTKLRYFSGTEMARLMGYPKSFSFPPGMPVKQQWKLVGNSLNVRLASILAEFALRSAGIEGCAPSRGENEVRKTNRESIHDPARLPPTTNMHGSVPMPSGTYLFDYLGEVLNEDEYETRYSHGRQADYAVGVRQGNGTSLFIDAVNPDLSNIARYSNHDGRAPNLRAWTLYEPTTRLMLFANRDIESGEELVWDYGEDY